MNLGDIFRDHLWVLVLWFKTGSHSVSRLSLASLQSSCLLSAEVTGVTHHPHLRNIFLKILFTGPRMVLSLICGQGKTLNFWSPCFHLALLRFQACTTMPSLCEVRDQTPGLAYVTKALCLQSDHLHSWWLFWSLFTYWDRAFDHNILLPYLLSAGIRAVSSQNVFWMKEWQTWVWNYGLLYMRNALGTLLGTEKKIHLSDLDSYSSSRNGQIISSLSVSVYQPIKWGW